MTYETKSDELYHYGRLGMKWGRNIFGKDKTGSGLRKKRSRVDQGENLEPSQKPRSHKDMTDEELRKKTDRLNLEANYLSAKSRANIPGNQQPSKKSFAKEFVDGAIKPAIIAAGRTQIEKYLNTQVNKLTKGKVDPNSLEYLKKQAEILGLKTKISTSKKIIDSNNRYFKEQRDKDSKEINERLNQEGSKLFGDQSKSSNSDIAEIGKQSTRSILDRYGNVLLTVNANNKNWWE